jgi:metal-responsive CopG/Arc/MetJ family transcriptional regulator
LFDFKHNVGYYSYKYPHYKGDGMRTIQMTLDDDLVTEVDNIVKKLKTTRSAFARKALRDAIRQAHINALENKHKKGYDRYPVGNTEFSVWESEQEWGN